MIFFCYSALNFSDSNLSPFHITPLKVTTPETTTVSTHRQTTESQTMMTTTSTSPTTTSVIRSTSTTTLSPTTTATTVDPRGKIYIGFWTGCFGMLYWGMGRHTVNIDNCVFTHRKDYFSSPDKFDALLFHGVENDWNKPNIRSPNQLYIMEAAEYEKILPIVFKFANYF
jgi:hypothetical protein